MSEAPPASGGFWTPPPRPDDLRDKLFGILRAESISLPPPSSSGALERFTSVGFFLIQTVKWPLCTSARTLRPAKRVLIEHSASAHPAAELEALEPSAIIPLGKAACYAVARLCNNTGFAFTSTSKLEDVRGKSFTARFGGQDGVPVHPSGLPLKRRQQDLPRIAQEVAAALGKHWDPAAGHVRRRAVLPPGSSPGGSPQIT